MSDRFAFTEGPWIIEAEQPNKHGNLVSLHVAQGASGGRICEVFANCLVTTDAELRANAHLITAAESLLEALIECRSVLRTALAETPIDDEFKRRVLGTRIAAATVAINKAWGKK